MLWKKKRTFRDELLEIRQKVDDELGLIDEFVQFEWQAFQRLARTKARHNRSCKLSLDFPGCKGGNSHLVPEVIARLNSIAVSEGIRVTPDPNYSDTLKFEW